MADEEKKPETEAAAEGAADATEETAAKEASKESDTPTETTEEAKPSEEAAEEASEEPAATDADASEAEKVEEEVEEVTVEKLVSPDVVPGMVVRVHQKIRETNTKGEERERVQVFEGMIIAKKGSSPISATITVRKVSSGIGVERIFPLHSPNIVKFEVVKHYRVRRSKLYYLRNYKKRLHEVKKKATLEAVK